MKLYISYALASLLVAVPLVASHEDADKAAQVKKATQQNDDEVHSAPVAKKIAQTLWKHKGKIAIGVASAVILATIVYLYRDSLYALFVVNDLGKPNPSRMTIKQLKGGEDAQEIKTEIEKIVVTQKDEPVAPVQENNMQTAQPEIKQPSVETDIQLLNEVASELGLEIKTVAPASAILGEQIVIEKPDGGIMVLPVSQGTVVFLEPKPVTPTNVPEVTPIVPTQELTQTPDALPTAPASEQALELPKAELSVHEELVALAAKQNPNGEMPAIKWHDPSSIIAWVRAMNAHLWQTQPETPQPPAESNPFVELKQISETGTPEQQIVLADAIDAVQK